MAFGTIGDGYLNLKIICGAISKLMLLILSIFQFHD
jgi:hypothetical protein